MYCETETDVVLSLLDVNSPGVGNSEAHGERLRFRATELMAPFVL